MLISKKPVNDSNFTVLINQNLIEKSECVKYLGVHLATIYLGKLIQASFAKKSQKCVE